MIKRKDMNNGEIKDLSESQLINKDIELNIQYIKSQIGINADLLIRHIPLIVNGNDKGCIIYLNNLIDDKSLIASVLMPFFKAVNGISFSEVINNLPFSKVEQIKYINLAILEIFKGKTLLLIQNSLQGYLLSIESEEKRSIQEPTTDKTLRGSKEGFTESIISNVLMIRRKLPDYNLVVEAFLLEIMIEFLREMGIRLPQPIGNSLGVVGGIVLGDAAIRANLVTPTAVISFVLPNYNMVSTLCLIRFPVMIMSGL